MGYRSFMNNCLPLESWEEIQGYKQYVQQEINRVMWLASQVNPGLEREIWDQARGKYMAIKQAQELAMLKEAEKRARNQAKREKKEAARKARNANKSSVDQKDEQHAEQLRKQQLRNKLHK